MKPLVRSLAFAVTSLFAVRASAQPKDVSLHAEPVLGDATRGAGWGEVLIRMENRGKGPIAGRARVKSGDFAFLGDDQEVDSVASVTLPEGRTTDVKLPIFLPYGASEMKATFEIEGQPPLVQDFALATNPSPSLLDLHAPSRLLTLRGWPLGVAATYPATSELSISAARRDVASGDPVLPAFPTAYASTTVVLVPSDAFVRLEERPRRALLAWVTAGGTLAFAVSRPEDLRHPAVLDLLGGEAREAPLPEAAKLLPTHSRGTAPPQMPHRGHMRHEVDGTKGPFELLRTDGVRNARALVPQELAPDLHGYVGGKIVTLGSLPVAPYGLGYVHLLPGDPGGAAHADDAWMQSRLLDVVTEAWGRKAPLATRLGAQGATDLPRVRKVLDPNQSFQIPLGLSSILLLAFAVVAGPLLFARAQRLRRPFAPLKWVPIASATTFALVVFIGLASKGIRGRVRRLVIVEAREGFETGAAKRLRGYFFGGSNDFTVHGENEWSVVRPFASGRDGKGSLVVRRDGTELAKLPVDPWKTTVVSDEGIEELGGTVRFVPSGSSFKIVSTFQHRLVHAIVAVPGDRALYLFDTISPGATVDLKDGHSVASKTIGPYGLTEFVPSALFLSDRDPLDLFSAVESTMEQVDWFPSTTPVLMAELDRPMKRDKDEGYRVETERTVVRILGSATR